MTSLRKLHANRRNARRCTGPRTAAGKARSAQNARRHGLTRPARADPVLARRIEVLARAILNVGGTEYGAATDADCRAWAERIAVAQIDLIRVRQARRALYDSGDAARDGGTIIKRLTSLDRYEGRALSRRKRAIWAF